MTKESIKEKIKTAVAQEESNAQVILFGSQARGNSRAASDWDVLVLLDQPSVSFKDEQRIRHRLYDVELEIEESISTFVYAAADWNTRHRTTPLFRSVEKEGVLL